MPEIITQLADALRGKVGLFDLLSEEGAFEFTMDRERIARGGWLFRLQAEGFVFNLAFENHPKAGPSVLVQRNNVVSIVTTKELPKPVRRCRIIVNWDESMVQLVCGWARWVKDSGRVPAKMPKAPEVLVAAAAAYDAAEGA